MSVFILYNLYYNRLTTKNKYNKYLKKNIILTYSDINKPTSQLSIQPSYNETYKTSYDIENINHILIDKPILDI